MKNLFLSAIALIAFAMTAQAQLDPGSGFTYNPGLPNQCTPDLYFGHIGELPPTAHPGDVVALEVTIRLQGECAAGQSNLLVYFQEGSLFVPVNVTVPAFAWDDNYHTVEVLYTVPPGSSGIPIYVSSITIDSNSQVSESNENNNYIHTTPAQPMIIL